jgi:hypothetical protein
VRYLAEEAGIRQFLDNPGSTRGAIEQQAGGDLTV